MIEEIKKYSQERTVIGFDIRKGSSLHNLFMTSYDEEVRYENIYEKYQKYRSGINLFFVDPSSITLLEIPVGALVVAFDLPNDLVEDLLNGNVSRPYPLPEINIRSGEWAFVGFDVVDPYTQRSAFHAFGSEFSREIIDSCSIVLNNYGLLENIESALKVSGFCDNNVQEYAPFSPCGIWLKKCR
jgi:hypothetical protein